MTIAGAVLTGGASRRMGRTKALVEIEGTPMARRVADAVADAGCSPVRLIGGDPDELAVLGLPVVPDRSPGAGPLGGILDALAASPGDVLVVACDLPDLTAEVLSRLIDAAAERPDVDVAVAFTDRLEPGCTLWRQRALAPLREQFEAGERAVHRALAQLTRVDVDVPPEALRNVNTLDDV